MADDKLKQELLYMASITSKYDFTKMEVVEGILRLENERRILDSVFGRRFKARIFDIAAGVSIDEACVLCGQHADNHVICNHCMETILGSDYAKNKIKTKETRRFSLAKLDFTKIKLPDIKLPKIDVSKTRLPDIKLPKIFQYAAIVCLTLILFIQSWLVVLALSIPDMNPTVEAKVSDSEPVAVSDYKAAKAQLEKDFPADQGYTVTFAREDTDYVGRFLLEKGECCEEVEEKLTDEERYDYFFNEPVFIFYISYNEENAGKVGMAEVNAAGAILVMGSFNDGRRTDSFYKYR
ncbi:hypothetical protein SAMN04487831_101395 [Pseudobutyrivibrio sp. UC1225]|uniref:hypothetical protein n=1 Tax=Pseudobutyrivibrio sp. UC1225 TaxID=1798185 RepID=UPI0008E36412|nr:hypothetical protein [Pseudobutyrivibrio sp. UC1225]SFN48775.1 hypothetical protein SAMN04487831_101395 [Pseudobutyrivibrio sp. UC1225]